MMEPRRNGRPTLVGIWGTYRLKIAGTLSLLAVERMLGVAVPFVLGVAINDLIAGSFRGVWWLIGLESVALLIGTARRLYDSRVYAGIYTDVADNTAQRTDLSVSRRAARLGLARELVDFFEWELPELLAALVGILGALAMLLYLLPTVGGLSIVVGVLVGVVFAISRNRMFNLNKLLNNELERQVTMLESGRVFSRWRHLSRLARWRIHLSDLEAANFAIAELFLSALIIGAVVLTVRTGLSVGEVFAVLTYLIGLAENLIVLPWTYQQSIRAHEIGGRIASG
ncbi:MAG: ABC transporter six-transmembrane domain-containing protein [Pseudomonadota bacterium]